MEPVPGEIPCCTMHLAKGLEFKAVVVMACDDEGYRSNPGWRTSARKRNWKRFT